MFAVAPLQLSWLAAVFRSWIVSPVQLPVPLPEGTAVVPTEPPIEKSAVVQAGFAASPAPPLIELTTAVIEEIVTAEAFGLSKFPLNVAAGPPGYKPLTVLVWFTVIVLVVPAVAVPLPVPPCVQYAYAPTAMASTATTPTRRKMRRLLIGSSVLSGNL